MFSKSHPQLICLCFLFFLGGCQVKDDVYQDRPATELYKNAQTELNQQNYTKAAKDFAEVERQHPYSNWALRAQIMSAYSFYMAKKYDDAIDGFQTFIQLHPGHADVPYAYYMMGICYYEQIPIVQRDQEPAEKAFEIFKELSNRFSSSVYAKDARLKQDLIFDHLAGKEMYVGRFYQKTGSHIAAINRFKVVVERYSRTSQAPEAMYRLVESYLTLGLNEDAKTIAAVLGHNFKDSVWYKEAYALLQQKFPLISFEKNKKDNSPQKSGS